MFKKFFNIVGYLDLKNVGLLEMTFALTPILSGFTLSGLPLSSFMWVLLICMVAFQGKLHKLKVYSPLLIFVIYWFLHEFFVMFTDKVNINGLLSQIICFVAVFVSYPIIDEKKLKGSLNWVALISIIGLLYQWIVVVQGGFVHPLGIPGLTMSESRLLQDSLRPSSFFMEPASYVAFTICPLYFAMMEKKYVWMSALMLSMFLTTSTTGIVVSFIMLGVSVLNTSKNGKWTIISTLFIGAILYYSLTNLDAFQFGMEKLENTDTTTNVRLTQGRYVVSTMDASEYILGVPFSTAYNYCKAGRASDVIFYGESVFMPTFWETILLYGFVGLLLYLNVYFQIFRKSRQTIILLSALFAVLFSSSYGLGCSYLFSLIVLLVVKETNIRKSTKIKKYSQIIR